MTVLQKKPGKPPTIRDVAARAGVSPMTVSRVLNACVRVSPKTKSAVEQAIKELHYIPNASAKALSATDFRRIALLHSDSMTSAYVGELLLGALQEASDQHVYLVMEHYVPGDTPQAVLSQIAAAHVGGVILPPPLCDWEELIEALLAEGLAVVAIAPDRERDNVPRVYVDDRRAAYEMTSHLFALGHERIAFVNGHPAHRGSQRRLEGFKEAHAHHLKALDDELIVPGDFSFKSGLEAGEKLLGSGSPPTAIFACNDDMAAAVLTVAHQQMISVPAQLTICGFDDTPLASSIWPNLTTVRQPIQQMSRAAVKILSLAMLSGPQTTQEDGKGSVQLGFQIVRRQTDAIPAYH